MKSLKSLLAIASLTVLSGCGCEQIDTGYRGIETRFGEIQGQPLPEGLYFFNPFTSKITEIDVREQKIEGQAVSYTRDTQRVDITFAVTVSPDPSQIHVLYKEFGFDWDKKIIPQVIQGAIKDVVGRYIADDLVGKRDEARSAAENELQKNLESRHIRVTRLDFANLDFDDAYEKAVEAKVVAVQKASEAKNKTVEVEEQAKQKVIAAEAEAKSMSIRSQALTQNKGLIEYEAVQKWDGKLPEYMLGNAALPFINLKGKD